MNGLLLALTLVQGDLTIVLPDRDTTIAGATLEAMATDTLMHSFHGRAPIRFTGVSINRIFDLVGVESRGLRGDELAAYVVVEAADGYRVVYGAGELDPATTGRTVLLANRESGEPLSAEYGPWQLIMPGDARGARSIRQVVRIRLVRLPER